MDMGSVYQNLVDTNGVLQQLAQDGFQLEQSRLAVK